MIPGFESGIIGMKKGEEKEIKVTFPEKYQKAELAGKEAIFLIKLNNVPDRTKREHAIEKVGQLFSNFNAENECGWILSEFSDDPSNRITAMKIARDHLQKYKTKFLNQVG